MSGRNMTLLRKYAALIRDKNKRPGFLLDDKTLNIGHKALKRMWDKLPHRKKGEMRRQILRAMT